MKMRSGPAYVLLILMSIGLFDSPLRADHKDDLREKIREKNLRANRMNKQKKALRKTQNTVDLLKSELELVMVQIDKVKGLKEKAESLIAELRADLSELDCLRAQNFVETQDNKLDFAEELSRHSSQIGILRRQRMLVLRIEHHLVQIHLGYSLLHSVGESVRQAGERIRGNEDFAQFLDGNDPKTGGAINGALQRIATVSEECASSAEHYAILASGIGGLEEIGSAVIFHLDASRIQAIENAKARYRERHAAESEQFQQNVQSLDRDDELLANILESLRDWRDEFFQAIEYQEALNITDAFVDATTVLASEIADDQVRAAAYELIVNTRATAARYFYDFLHHQIDKLGREPAALEFLSLDNRAKTELHQAVSDLLKSGNWKGAWEKVAEQFESIGKQPPHLLPNVYDRLPAH